jgi:hypothetical protein
MRAYPAIASAAALSALLAGCPSPRTSPYTQPGPAEFNPDDSDDRAIEIVDAVIADLGGLEAWEEVKQIRWEQRVLLGEEIRGLYMHSWDRWNARHRWEQPTVPPSEAPKAEDEAEDEEAAPPSIVAMYRIYEPRRATVTLGGAPVADDDAARLVDAARQTFDQSHYALAGYYKLKDPGVRLKHQGESEPMGGFCEPACAMIHISFDPEVGDDSYVLHVNKDTGKPEILATQTGAGQLAYGLAEWQEVAGLSFPVVLQNLGNDAERIEHANIEIGEVQDSLYKSRPPPPPR